MTKKRMTKKRRTPPRERKMSNLRMADASDEDEDDEEDEEGAKTENRKIDETEVDSDSDGSSSSGDDDSDASLDDDSAKTPKSKKKRVPSSEMTDCGVQLTEDEVVETIVCDEKSRTIEFTVPAGINSPHVLVLEIAQEVAVKNDHSRNAGNQANFRRRQDGR